MDGVIVKDSWDAECRPFVYSTFASGYRRHSGIQSEHGFRAMVLEPFELAERRGELAVKLLCLDGAEDDFVAWSACIGDALIYTYTKLPYRRRGFASSLLPDGLERVVFQTPAGVFLQRARYGKVLKSAPYVLAERRAA